MSVPGSTPSQPDELPPPVPGLSEQEREQNRSNAANKRGEMAGSSGQREPGERRPTRVLIVDDHAVVRNGIAFSLLAFADLQVIGQASSGEEALALVTSGSSGGGGGGLQPEVVLMDLLMPGMGGVAAIRALRAALPEVAVVALTSFQEGSLVEEALQAGAIGYLLKDVEVDELGKAIRLARQGMPILAPAAAQALVHTVVRRPPPIGADLTEREREVLGLLTHGLSNQQIAERLVITPATVKFHTRSIRSKLGTSTRTETVVLALHHHLVPAQPSQPS